MVDYLGLVMSLITIALELFGAYSITFCCIFPWYSSPSGLLGLSSLGFMIALIFNSFIILALLAHSHCMFTDAGATPEYPAPIEIPLRELRYCTYCDQWKPPRTHHCTNCDRCYHKMDHHCPWVNNCVAAKNQKFFILFNLYTCLAAALGLVIVLVCCVNFLYAKQSFRLNFFNVVVGCLAFIECLLFMIFTGDFLREQYIMVRDNQTTVETYQKRWGKPVIYIKLTFTQSLYQVLGPNQLLWLIPIYTDIPIDYLEPAYTTEQRNEMLKTNEENIEKQKLLDE